MQFKNLSIAAILAAAVSAQNTCACPGMAPVTVTSIQFVTVQATSSVVAQATPPPFPTGAPPAPPMPTGTGGMVPTQSPPPFTGAGSSLNSNTVVAVIGAGLAAFALI